MKLFNDICTVPSHRKNKLAIALHDGDDIFLDVDPAFIFQPEAAKGRLAELQKSKAPRTPAETKEVFSPAPVSSDQVPKQDGQGKGTPAESSDKGRPPAVVPNHRLKHKTEMASPKDSLG